MAFQPFSAKNSKIRIGSTVYTAKKWTATPDCPEEDATNFESGGFYVACGTIYKLTVSIDDADIDATANPYDTPPGVQAGSFLANVKLYWNAYQAGLNGPFWSIPSLYISSAPNTHDVKSTGKISVKGVGSGTFSYPTGPAT